METYAYNLNEKILWKCLVMSDKCGLWWIPEMDWSEVYQQPVGLVELYLHAISRGISIDKDSSNVCLAIQLELPSKEWTEKVLQAYQTRLGDDERALVSRYTDTAFVSMNNTLRGYPEGPAPINDIIEKMPSLDKEVTVYRHIRTPSFLPTNVGNIFVSNGYLSTTLNALSTRRVVCKRMKETKRGAMLKIILPIGTKVLYIPSHEVEFILSHGLKLRLISYTKGKIVCPIEDKESYIQDDVPIFEFIALN